MTNPSFQRRLRSFSFTLVELLVVIAVIGLLLALLLPAVRTSSEASRRMSCGNHFKQLGLAMHQYHTAFGQFPAAMGGTDRGPTPIDGNANRLSGIVAMLPYMEGDQLWDQIVSPANINGVQYPAMGPAPWVSAYSPWTQGLPLLRCPSSDGAADDRGFARTNYAFSIGDAARDIHQAKLLRGVFASGLNSRIKDIKDGTSNTIAMAEIGSRSELAVVGQYAMKQPSVLDNPGACRNTLRKRKSPYYAPNTPLSALGRGGRWADGAAGFSMVNTVLPPNSPSCAIGASEESDGVYSAGSLHPGGAMSMVADGSVRFINADIDAGDSRTATLTAARMSARAASPFGVWGALGTASSAEDVAVP